MFNFFKTQKKIGGEIGYYGLEEWWINTFTDGERSHIKDVFRPLGADPNSSSLTDGDISYSSQSAAGLLYCLAGWFNNANDREIAKKIIAKACELAQNDGGILDLHFALQQKMEIYYRERDNDTQSLNVAVDACVEQIKIALQAARQFRKEYPKDPLPGHAGYSQLAIIYKKQGKYKEVIELCQQAKKQGWSGSWGNRIEEAKKKLDK